MKRRIFKQFLSGILGIILLLSLAGCGQSTSDSKPDDTMDHKTRYNIDDRSWN